VLKLCAEGGGDGIQTRDDTKSKEWQTSDFGRSPIVLAQTCRHDRRASDVADKTDHRGAEASIVREWTITVVIDDGIVPQETG
jgi:hypothetical protein